MIYTVDRRKPPLPQAVQWDGHNVREVAEFVNRSVRIAPHTQTLMIDPPLDTDTGKIDQLFDGSWVVYTQEGFEVYLDQSGFHRRYEIVRKEGT